MEDFLLHGHEYEYDINWIVCTLKRHGVELSQIDQKIKDAVKLELSDERITALVIDIISNASGIVNVKIPPAELTPATGDGSKNDTEAIQGCIDYVHQKGEGAVFFPSGKYLTNSLTLYDNVALVGESRYTTSLVAAMGSRNVVIGENASMVSIANMTLDGNQPYQVNDIDGVALTGKDWLFTNLIVKDVLRAFVLTLDGEHCQMDNVVIEGVGDSAITILGGKEVQMHQVHVSGISSTIGQYGIEVTSDHAWMTDMVIDSQIPVGLILNGDMCYFDGYIYGVTEPYRDGGNSNSITVRGVSKKEVYGNDCMEAIGGDKNISASTISMDSKDFLLNTVNPVTYKQPIEFTKKFSYVPFKHEDETYKVLVATDYTSNSFMNNVMDYGAVGDGVTDDTEAFNAALAAGDIVVPEGIYLIANKLTVNNRRIVGNACSWEYATRDNRPAILLPKQPILTNNSTWENLTFYGGIENGSKINIGLFDSASRENIVRVCKISGFSSATEAYVGTIVFDTCMISQNTIGINSITDSRVVNCFIMENDTGIYLGNGASSNIIEENKIEWNGQNDYGINIDNASANVIVGNLLDRNGKINIRVYSAQSTIVCNNVIMRSSEINEKYISCYKCIFDNVSRQEHSLDNENSDMWPPRIGMEIDGGQWCTFGGNIDDRLTLSIINAPENCMFNGLNNTNNYYNQNSETVQVPYADELIIKYPANLRPTYHAISKLCAVTVTSNAGSYSSLYLLNMTAGYIDSTHVAGIELPNFAATLIGNSDVKITFDYQCTNKTARLI